MTRSALGIIVVLLFLAILAIPLSTAYGDAPVQNKTVTNETVTLNEQNRTAVSAVGDAESFSDGVEVYQNGTEYHPPNYTWYEDTGELGGSANLTGEVNVSYEYQDKSNPTDAGAAILGLLLVIVATAVVAGAGLTAFAFAAVGLTSGPGGR